MKLCTACTRHFEDELEVCPSDSTQLIYIGRQPLVGSVVGNRYKVLGVIGAGSMGVVYKALQLSTGRELAIKVLHKGNGADSVHVGRFKREAKAVSCINHQNIVRLYDFGFMDDAQPYIVTEFVKGITLAYFIRQQGRLPINDALPIVHQVCDAVAEAHRHKVIHRDLKPENIVLEDADSFSSIAHDPTTKAKFKVKVVDFGVAKLSSDAGSATATLTVEGKVCGSPGYMSPEQCKGLSVDDTSDIYSLGIVFYELICGQRPFSADTVMGLLFMHVNDKPPPMAAMCLDLTVPVALEDVIQRSLSKDPRDRQQSALELWREFEAACHGTAKRVAAVGKNKASNWIPFVTKQELLNEAERAPSLNAIDELEFLISQNRESGNQKKPPVRFAVSWSWFLKAAFMLVIILFVMVLETEFFPRSVHLHEQKVGNVDSLVEKGRLVDAVGAIDKLKRQHKISNENFESANGLYLQVASKYAQKKDYANAVSALKHVSPKSKYRNQATKMIKNYNRLIAD